MRQFNLYRRGQIFYCRFKDETTGKWLSGISTGETERNAAMAQVAFWERFGIPERGNRSPDSITETRRIIDKLKTADLSPNEAQAVVDLLTDRGFIAAAVMTGERDAGPVAAFLNRPLEEYLLWFWNFDESEYIRGKLRHGHSMTRTHCDNRQRHVRNHWTPWLREHPVTLAATTRATIDAFSAHLAEKDLAAQTRNHILTTATGPLSYAFGVGAIPDNPARGVTFYSVKHTKRGTLTTDEVERLFRLNWPSDAAMLANLTAATTGARSGEVAAIRVEDIGEDRLHIRRSWNRDEARLKGTKTNEERITPLAPALRDQLLAHAARNPHGITGDSFVFWSPNHADRPLSARRFYDGLRDALAMLDGLSADDVTAAHRAAWVRREERVPAPEDARAEERYRESLDGWKARGVSFHSWRHFFVARMADRVNERAMTAAGHKTRAVYEVYAAHADAETFQRVADAAGEAFAQVIPFPAPTDAHEAVG